MDTVQLGRTTLDDAPQRALAFLSGVSQVPAIRAGLDAQGYDDAEHALGWTLLHTATGYVAPSAAGGGVPGFAIAFDPEVRKAIVELDAWDEPNFARIEAALERQFPAQAAFVFENLAPTTGPGAVLTVSTLLGRLTALESGTGRKSTHKEDLAAVKLLEKRGYTTAERDRLSALVKVAQKGATGAASNAAQAKQDAAARAAHDQALAKLYGWWKDWSTTARAEFKRRDYLIRLGLATRKSPIKPGATDEGTAAVASTVATAKQ